MFTQAMNRDGFSFIDSTGKVLCWLLGHGCDRVVNRTSRIEVPICPQPMMARVVPPLIFFLSLPFLFVNDVFSLVSGIIKRGANQEYGSGTVPLCTWRSTFSNIYTRN